MYLPGHFAQAHDQEIESLVRDHPLATLVAMGRQGLIANHIPMMLARDEQGGRLLHGHVARANPLWREFDPNLEVLAIFQGPDAYISPNWYASKRQDGKVVPTWNYCTVHACGRMRAIEDPGWLRAFVGVLTKKQESAQPAPWAVEDAPPDYIEKMIANIVGIEIALSAITGKWKASQNQSAANRAGAIAALSRSADSRERDMAHRMERPSG
jgi:transcriptional regulator